MTTPRVTVPVEPEYTATEYLRLIAEGWEVIESTGSQMTIQNPEDDGPQELVIDVDLLCAAPAPEGGAVSDALQRLRVLRDQARNGTAVSDPDEHDADELDAILSVIEPALATREEAPAEAGEIDLYDDKVQAGIAWTMRQWGETLGLKTWTMGDGSESVEGDVGAEIHTILVDAGLRDPETNEMAALRAQPPAREDAQPVGWLRAVDEEMVCAHLGVADAKDSFETAKKKLASLIQWNIAVATDPSVGGHPAPGALQVAAADLLAEVDATAARIGWADHGQRERLRRALAALQAEQKGGAA